jgi:DUF971 family protein/molybdopterin converting factor small subunit
MTDQPSIPASTGPSQDGTPQPSRHSTQRHPIEISLHAKSRILSIAFDDGARFDLPCEYLRVFSRAAEVRLLDQPVTGKEGVNIERIDPQGQYAIRIVFDDGHDTGIYSWDSLYALGVNQEANWAAYLERLERLGYRRTEPEHGDKSIKLLYFSWLAKKVHREAEQVTVPAGVADVDGLLRWLGGRRRGAGPLFEPGRLRVTVNKQFTEGFTKLHDGDEVGLVPTTPTPPPTPDLL